MSLYPHLIFNPQPTAIWLQPTLFYWNCHCQLRYDLDLLHLVGVFQPSFLFRNTFDPVDHFFSHTHSFSIMCDILFPWFSFSTSGYFFTVLFLDFSSSAHLLCADTTQVSMQDSHTSKWGQRIIYLKIMGWDSTCQKCRFVSYILYLLNKTLWSWYPGFWILWGLLSNSSDPKVWEPLLNIFSG